MISQRPDDSWANPMIRGSYQGQITMTYDQIVEEVQQITAILNAVYNDRPWIHDSSTDWLLARRRNLRDFLFVRQGERDAMIKVKKRRGEIV